MQETKANRHTATSLYRHRFLFAGILCLLALCLLNAQGQNGNDGGPKKTRVDLLYADEAQADKEARPDVQVLIGSVKLRHDSMYMYCDSALIYENINSVEAFGNVRMEQGDTLFIYGDYLYYDGMSQLAMLRENVRMINRQTELTTDSLDYDRVREDDRVSVDGVTRLAPGSRLTLTLHHADGTAETFLAQHTYNKQQIAWFKAGSALNSLSHE